jgi:hypothetical protein
VKTDENGNQGEITSIESGQSIPNVRIYPNPAENIVFISTEGFHDCTIFNIDGKLIQKDRILNSQIDVSALKPGSYIFELTGDKTTHREIILIN